MTPNAYSPNRPDDEQRCIWMDAGLVSYKLCDRSFQCEECPFDGIMQSRSARRYGSFSAPAQALQATHGSPLSQDGWFEFQLAALMKPFDAVKLPEDRLYTRNHIWVQEESREVCRFGIDHLGAAMLSPVSGVVFSQTPSRIEQGAPCVWMVHTDGAQALGSPLTGTLLYANRTMSDAPSSVAQSPYADGWMMTISPERSTTRFTGLMEPDDAAEHFAQQGQLLKVELQNAYRKMRPAVGPTMNDGGAANLPVSQMLGLATYYRIVNEQLMKSSQ